jgi:EpsI family protein
LLTVNRAIIAKGSVKQLVYYWFEQRGRILASEYDVKWYLFVDGLFKRRSDGALLRVITPIEGRNVHAADTRLAQFVSDSYPRLRAFLPR